MTGPFPNIAKVNALELKELERDSITRTLEITKQYNEHVMHNVPEENQYEETLLINCLIGLLVLPKEKWNDQIKKLPDDITAWGVPHNAVESWGKCKCCGKDSDQNLTQCLRRLRNAASHIRFAPVTDGGIISGWTFEDKSGFKATLQKEHLRGFLNELAESLLKV